MDFNKLFKYSAVFVLTLAGSSNINATDLRVAYGAHDFYVDEANSHTLGAAVTLSFSHITQSNLLLAGSFDTFADIDNDKLDPDHIPVWFSSHFIVKGDLYRFNQSSSFYWDIEQQWRMNTVNSVEQQLSLFPELGYEINTDKFQLGAKTGMGLFLLEIDDDVPRIRGFDRADLSHTVLAYTFAIDSRVAITSKLDAGAQAQHWTDGDDWLQNQYAITLSYSTNDWIEDSVIVLSGKYTEFNLAHYPTNSTGQILPWNNDTLVRLYFEMPW